MPSTDNPILIRSRSDNPDKTADGEWVSTGFSQQRLEDNGYCRSKIEMYDKRLKDPDKKATKLFSNSFEMVITSDAQRKKYMGLDWSSDVYVVDVLAYCRAIAAGHHLF
eukprot:SAG25_NODE_4016_length_907_cov_1.433168_1_plen_109_part_00